MQDGLGSFLKFTGLFVSEGKSTVTARLAPWLHGCFRNLCFGGDAAGFCKLRLVIHAG